MRLTVAEKRTKMLDWFHETQSFFQLKDVEKICSVEKGITMNTCKDILQMLTDDGLVETEKIGSMIYFWSLPSKALAKKREEVIAAEAEIITAQKRNDEIREKLDKFRAEQSRDDSDKAEEGERRVELERAIQELTQIREKMRTELQAFKENDPGQASRWRDETEMAKKAVNRWVENIFSLKSWMKRKFGCEEKIIDRQFDIPEDLDYVC